MSRHRFLKHDVDDYSEDEDEDFRDDFDEEVYLVYDSLIDFIPDLTFEEIDELLVDYDYNVEDVVDFICKDAGIKQKITIKQPIPPQQQQQPPQQQQKQQNKNNKNNNNAKPQQNNSNNNNNNNKKEDEIKKLSNNIKSIQIQQPINKNSTTVDSKTPYNTPTGNTPISDSVLKEENNNVNSHKVKQHSDNRKKELEEMVHKSFSSTENKPHLNMVVIGHVDAGKSTTMGHLLFKLGHVDKRTMDKFEHESNRMGKSSFHFAWVLDEHEEERERGVTMDVCMRYFETPHRSITILDAPGHRDFIPNMISGTTQADVAILLINANEFESGFSTEGQTREHALLAKSLGIMQLIVAINKMDMIEYSEERYNYICEIMKQFLSTAKFSEKSTRFIPISGFTGENLVDRKEERMSWFKGSTLIEYIDSFSVGERLINKPFRMNVNDIYKSTSKGLISVGGKIEAGVIGQSDKILIAPGNEICTIKTIRRNHIESEWGVGGDNVDITLQLENVQAIRVGSILCDPEKPIPLSKKFQAQIVTFVLTTPIICGTQAVFHAHSMEEPATITKLVSILDGSGQVSKKNPRCISDTTTAIVEIQLSRLSCLELYSSFRQLGRFTLREAGKTVAAGIISEFLDHKLPIKKPKSTTTTTTISNNNNKK